METARHWITLSWMASGYIKVNYIKCRERERERAKWEELEHRNTNVGKTHEEGQVTTLRDKKINTLFFHKVSVKW
jgi:hypothetical protein